MELKRALAMSLLLFAAPLVGRTEPSGELVSLVEAVTRRNPGARSAEAQAQAARQGLREAKARSFPQLRAESVLTRSDNPVYVFGTLLQQRSFEARYFDIDFLNRPGAFTNIRSSLELGVPIFTGFALQNGRRLATLGVSQAENMAESARQATRFRIVNAYLTALLKDRQTFAVDHRIVEANREVNDANRLKAKGLVLGSDYYAAEAILAGLKTWRVRLSAERDAALSEIAVLAGRNAPESFHFSLSGSTYPVASESNLAKEALSARSEILTAALQTKAASLSKNLESASVLPRVEAFASVATNTEDFSKNASDRMAGVRASLVFGDPAHFARRARAESMVQAESAAQAAVEENIRIEIAQSLAGYRGAVDSLAPAYETLERALKSLELFRPLYREGRQSIMEVLRAEEGLARAETNHLEILYRVHAGYARLLFATGRLDAQSVSEIERHLEVVK